VILSLDFQEDRQWERRWRPSALDFAHHQPPIVNENLAIITTSGTAKATGISRDISEQQSRRESFPVARLDIIAARGNLTVRSRCKTVAAFAGTPRAAADQYENDHQPRGRRIQAVLDGVSVVDREGRAHAISFCPPTPCALVVVASKSNIS
jgi:hypothetical protein